MKRAGDVLKAFLSGRLSPEGERVVDLVEAWREIAGSAAAHVRVRDVRGKVLVLEVDHPGWGQLIGLRKASFLASLGKRFPDLELEELRVVVVRSEDPPGEAGNPKRGAGSEGAEDPAGAGIDEALSSVSDEGLRKRLRDLYEQAEGKGEPGR